MKGQQHLVISSEPLAPGEDRQVLCGKIIKEAVWTFQSLENGEVANRTKTCPKCWAKLTPDEVTEYVYGAIPRAEAEKYFTESAG